MSANSTSVSLSTSDTTDSVTSTSASVVVPTTTPVTSDSVATQQTTFVTTSVSSVYVPPSTTYVAPTTSSTPSVVDTTSSVTITPTTTPGATTPSVVIVYSTQTSTYSPAAVTSTFSSSSSSSSAAVTSPQPSALSASGSGASTSSGVSSSGKIAIAVVVPIIAIILGFGLGLFFWRKHRARKFEEEQRKAEIEDYGLNPNADPALAPAAAAVGGYTGSEMAEDHSGYRGWGTTTSANRQASTTIGSGSRGPAAGAARSEASSHHGAQASPTGPYQYSHSPPGGTARGSDHYSTDPLVNGTGNGAYSPETGTVGELGRNRQMNSDIRRGPSNASSAYSTRPLSDISDDGARMGTSAPNYHEDSPYGHNYNEAVPQHGPYGDGTYGGAQPHPVLRNFDAKRDARIERAPTYPQGGIGIAQNF